ncbi:MAG: hypothetical protein LC649_04825 [Bacteroidales bacterium]|nr:hypothetical protein [Bacteroidales bacterium]
MEEPLTYFLKNFGFDLSKIKSSVIGEKYVAIMLNNGNTGVCATLGTRVDDSLLRGSLPDISEPSHRIIMNAWFNALCNYDRTYDDIVDIFERIDFSRYKEVVMVGYFESLYEKIRRDGIPLRVFDIHRESGILSDIKEMDSILSEAGAVILTGTTVFNKTFSSVISSTPDGCDIFLLGPSNILSDEMFGYRNIKVVFGSVFARNDHELLRRIGSGSGTRGFLDRLQKVYIRSDKFIL